MGGSASHSRRFQRRISTTEGGRRGGLGGDGRETGNSCLKQGLNSGRRWRPRKRRMAGESPLLNHHHAESFGRRQVAIYCHRLLAYRAEGSSGSKANGNALTDQRGWVESKQPAPENACQRRRTLNLRPRVTTQVHFPAPTGLWLRAQGCGQSAATLGQKVVMAFYPNGVASRRHDATPLG